VRKQKLTAERYFIGYLSLKRPEREEDTREVKANTERRMPILRPEKPMLVK
jgi:hypothetical protein